VKGRKTIRKVQVKGGGSGSGGEKGELGKNWKREAQRENNSGKRKNMNV